MTAPDPDLQQFSILVVVIGAGALIAMAAGISSIWKNHEMVKAARNPPRTPPMEEEAAKTYATKMELATLKIEMQGCCTLNHAKVDKIHTDIFNLIRASQSENRTMMEALHKDLNLWQLGVERQIGQLDERTKKS